MTTERATTAEELLRGAGLRSTAPRRAVLEVVLGAPHASSGDIAGQLAGAGRTMSRQSLANVLDDLTGAGLLRSTQPAGSAVRYETRVGDDHHHLVCRGCGTVVDVECAHGAAPCLLPATDPGFPVVERAEITWWGSCAECAGSPAR